MTRELNVSTRISFAVLSSFGNGQTTIVTTWPFSLRNNLECRRSVYEVISHRKWPSSYELNGLFSLLYFEKTRYDSIVLPKVNCHKQTIRYMYRLIMVETTKVYLQL